MHPMSSGLASGSHLRFFQSASSCGASSQPLVIYIATGGPPQSIQSSARGGVGVNTRARSRKRAFASRHCSRGRLPTTSDTQVRSRWHRRGCGAA